LFKKFSQSVVSCSFPIYILCYLNACFGFKSHHHLFIFTRSTLCQHGYMPMAFLFVSLCVTRMLCIKIAKHFIEIVLPPNSPIVLVFVTEGRCLTLMASPLMGAPNTRGGEKIGRILTNKLVHLGNGVRYGHSCHRSRIENHSQAIEWWHFS